MCVCCVFVCDGGDGVWGAGVEEWGEVWVGGCETLDIILDEHIP